MNDEILLPGGSLEVVDLLLHGFDVMVKAISELFLLACHHLPAGMLELQIPLRLLHSSLLALQLLLCSLELLRGKRLGN